MLQAAAAVGVGEGVAAPAAPGRPPVGVIGRIWQPAVKTAESRGAGVAGDMPSVGRGAALEPGQGRG